MPQVVFENVKLAFTQNMLHKSDFGSYDYSFIIDKDTFCNKVRSALNVQKTQVWSANKNTDEFILAKCNAKSKSLVNHDATKELMSDNDVLVQVKSKEAPIENTKKVQLGRGTTADILVDVFEFEYGKKQFICLRSHSERGCTVKVNTLNEFSNGPKYFDYDEDSDSGINKAAMSDIIVEENIF